MATQKGRAREAQWFDAHLAPVVLIKSKEPLLAERAVTKLQHLARQVEPTLDFQRVEAAAYEAGQLATYTSPSLFGETRFIYIPDLEAGSPALFDDLSKYVATPETDVTLVLRHNGGNSGKKVLTACAKANVATFVAPEMKSANDKMNLIREDVRRAKRQIEPAAVGALVDALGSDLAELSAMTQQLLADVPGKITEAHVYQYQVGRVEATVFAVADAAIAGYVAQALTLLRHALATGAQPPALVGAMASKIRQLAKVSVRPALSAKELGMQPWQADRARRDWRNGWTETRLRKSILALAQTDADVKGQSLQPHYALETLIMTVAGYK